MNLLKVLLLAICAASLSILFSTTAVATDHPWDDNSMDTGKIVGTVPVSGTEGTVVVTPIVQRFQIWARGVIKEIAGIIGWRERHDVEVKTRDTSGKRVLGPIGTKKYK